MEYHENIKTSCWFKKNFLLLAQSSSQSDTEREKIFRPFSTVINLWKWELPCWCCCYHILLMEKCFNDFPAGENEREHSHAPPQINSFSFALCAFLHSPQNSKLFKLANIFILILVDGLEVERTAANFWWWKLKFFFYFFEILDGALMMMWSQVTTMQQKKNCEIYTGPKQSATRVEQSTEKI